ncbi:hypothetical protein CEXT_473401, partial [Caerostris extrusa]
MNPEWKRVSLLKVRCSIRNRTDMSVTGESHDKFGARAFILLGKKKNANISKRCTS